MFVDVRGVVLSLCDRIGLLVGWRTIGMSQGVLHETLEI